MSAVQYNERVKEFNDLVLSPEFPSGVYKYIEIHNHIYMLYPNIQLSSDEDESKVKLSQEINEGLNRAISVIKSNKNLAGNSWFKEVAFVAAVLNKKHNKVSMEESLTQFGVDLPLDVSLFKLFTLTRDLLGNVDLIYRSFRDDLDNCQKIIFSNTEFKFLGLNLEKLRNSSVSVIKENLSLFGENKVKDYLQDLLFVKYEEKAETLWLNRLYFCKIFNVPVDYKTIEYTFECVGASWKETVKSNTAKAWLDYNIDINCIHEELMVDLFNCSEFANVATMESGELLNYIVSDMCKINQKEALMFLEPDVRKEIENNGKLLSDLIGNSPVFRKLWLDKKMSTPVGEDTFNNDFKL